MDFKRGHKVLSSSLFQQQPALLASKLLNKKLHSSSLRYQQDTLTKAKNALNYQCYTYSAAVLYKVDDFWSTTHLNNVSYNKNYQDILNFRLKEDLDFDKRYSEVLRSTDSGEKIHLILDNEDIIEYAFDLHAKRERFNGLGVEIEGDPYGDITKDHFYKACMIVFNDKDPTRALKFDLKFYASHYLFNNKPHYRFQRMEIDSISHHEGSSLSIKELIRNYVGTVKKDDKLSPMNEKKLFALHKHMKDFKTDFGNCFHGNSEGFDLWDYVGSRKDLAWWKKYEKPLKLKEERKRAHNKTFQNYKMQKFDRLDARTQKAFHDYVSNHLKINEYIHEIAIENALLVKSLHFGHIEDFTSTHSCEHAFPFYEGFYHENIDNESSKDCQAFLEDLCVVRSTMFKPIRFSRGHNFLPSSLFQHQSGPFLAYLNCYGKRFHSSSLAYQQDALTKAKNVLNYQCYAVSFIPGLESDGYSIYETGRVTKKEDYSYLNMFTSRTFDNNRRYTELFKKNIDTEEEIHLIMDTEDILKYSCDTHASSAMYNGKGRLQMPHKLKDETEEHFYKACLIVFNDGDNSKALKFDLKFYASHYLINEKPFGRNQRMEIDSVSHHEGSKLTIEGLIRNYIGTIKKDDKLSPVYEQDLFKEHEYKKECFLNNTNPANHGTVLLSYGEGKDVSWWKKHEKALKLKEERKKTHKKTFENYKMQKFNRLDKKTQKAFHDYVYHHLKINEYMFEKAVCDGLDNRFHYFEALEDFTNLHSCEFKSLIKDNKKKLDAQEDCEACKEFEALRKEENRPVILAEYELYEPYID
ncbi:hypothetical protein BN7_3247 [Wickerhamomyces ciferrii]|uniref:Uncharacterized protein n=1 Tax=Wickerhamomyces ciferrii (strain ATCC 14091 / BCRC 22168 / CBS 111 / JCM 3599 / NBRC 0793 / NRRL Y-1031 F-60-10) TaxID=1206466 RepID=K0KQY5_WICCF|nr:uncharacterized protein BN7_3247 [Wickerhamomyces ciferrii]CCH43693.1 hypothetical protein BN7_3247 [Wickerhamomyces ciferrii]